MQIVGPGHGRPARMLNDWIKMRTDLYRDPKVIVISDQLIQQDSCNVTTSLRSVMRNATVGALVSVWGVARHQGQRYGNDLSLLNVTLSVIDDICGLNGFGDAMKSAGWVTESESGLVFPKFFEENNVDPDEIKQEQNRDRQRRFREKNRSVTPPLQSNVSNAQRREEKSIKKEKSTSLSLAQKIYEAYPRHVGKAKALPAIEKAIEVITERGFGWMKRDAAAWLLERVQKFADSPAGKHGTFTPHPTTWMNGGRYDDDDAEWQRTDDMPAGRNAPQSSQQRGQDGGRQRRAEKSARELGGDIGQARSL